MTHDVTIAQARVASVLPTGTVTFLLTDIEGSTRLWEQHRDGMRAALARHDTLIEGLVGEHGGVVVRPRGEGDSRFAVFAQGSTAVAAAAAIQVALHQETWPLPEPLGVRIALHTGEADLRDGDYYGSAVNRCARLRSVAHGGQVLVSGTTAAVLRDQLPAGLGLRNLGIHPLKDLAEPEAIFQVIHSELPHQFPPLQSAEPPRGNLPAQPTPLIRREPELQEILKHLRRPEVRMLTLTGPGGVGKTRLALAVAHSLRGSMVQDGAWFVDLSALRDPAMVISSIAHVFGVREVGCRSLSEQLRTYLSDRRLVLLLDNCEQVLAAAPSIAELLAACVHFKVLSTSREPLRLRWEHVYPVPCLAIPQHAGSRDPETLAQVPSVAFFIACGQATDPAFVLSHHNAAAVAQLCARLDGLPLALELAAARVRVLTPAAMLARLGGGLHLLRGARDAPDRHQSLRAAIAWSYNLLDPEEQALFRHLSVFRGGCTLEAIQAVCLTNQTAIDDKRPLECLSGLVEKSLLRMETRGGSEPARYVLLETLREYASERLGLAGEETELRARHTAWCLALAEQAAAELRGPRQVAWMRRLRQELDNLRSALGHAADAGDAETGLRLGVALYDFWCRGGQRREGRRWMEAIFALPAEAAPWLRARGLIVAALLGVRNVDPGICRGEVAESQRLAPSPERSPTGGALLALADLASEEGDPVRSAMYLEKMIRVGRDREWPDWVAEGTWELAALWHDRHSGHAAGIHAGNEESLAGFRELGDVHGIARALHSLACELVEAGDPERAGVLEREALALFFELGDLAQATFSVESLGLIAAAQGSFEWAVRLIAAGAALWQAYGSDKPTYEEIIGTDLSGARAQLSEATFAAAWADGLAMSTQEVAAYALDADS